MKLAIRTLSRSSFYYLPSRASVGGRLIEIVHIEMPEIAMQDRVKFRTSDMTSFQSIFMPYE